MKAIFVVEIEYSLLEEDDDDDGDVDGSMTDKPYESFHRALELKPIMQYRIEDLLNLYEIVENFG